VLICWSGSCLAKAVMSLFDFFLTSAKAAGVPSPTSQLSL
jgi:hypothetical protein